MRIKRKLALMLTAVMIVTAIPIMNIQATGGSSSQNDGRSAPLNETVVGFTKEAPHSHSYSWTTRQPTCTASGRRTYTCRGCGYSYYITLSATGHTEVTVPGTAATCTETGLTDGKKCSVCGTVTAAQEIIPVTAHNYGAGGACKNGCGKTENGTAGFSGSSLTLKEGVTSNVSLSIENSSKIDYISFKSDQIDIKVPFDASSVNNGKCTVSIPVRPDQMTEAIKAQVICKDGTVASEIDYSVASYLDALGKNEEYKELAESMKTFGAFSQLYTGNNTDKLAAEVKHYEKNAEIADTYKMTRSGESNLVKFSSASLRINSNTAIRVGATIAAGTKVSDYKFKCRDSKGNEVALKTEVSGSKVYVSIRDIRPQDLDEMFTFSVTDKNGKTVTLNYSAYTYIKSQLESGTADPKLTDMLNAMVDYSKAAEAFAK